MAPPTYLMVAVAAQTSSTRNPAYAEPASDFKLIGSGRIWAHGNDRIPWRHSRRVQLLLWEKKLCSS